MSVIYIPIRQKQTDKRNMKKRIAIHLALSLATYTVIYFLTCFVTWDLKNPFQWIIDLPKYSEVDRLGVLSILVLGHIVINLITLGVLNRKKHEPEAIRG